MELRDIITAEVSKGSATSGTNDLESPLVEQGTVLELRHVAVENRTSDYTRLVIGLADALTFHQKEAEQDPLANEIYWTNTKFLIPPGKKLRARLTGCTSADDIHLTYEGYLWETKT